MDRRTSFMSCVTDAAVAELVVMKFGGSSVASASRFKQVVRIISNRVRTADPVVVVSAVGGITDRLAGAVDEMKSEAYDPAPLIGSLRELHEEIAGEILSASHAEDYSVILARELDNLHQDLVRLRGTTIGPSVGDRVLAVGERLSAPLLSRALSTAGCPSAAYDASALITTRRSNGKVSVDFERTQSSLQRWHVLREEEIIPVITGFIGGTLDGETTTLGRGGSDYSAAVIARALQAPVFERWTDVDGLYTKDPHENGAAERLQQITYTEALERTHRGDFGMHPRTLDPLKDTNTEVHVRGTLTPETAGTIITRDT